MRRVSVLSAGLILCLATFAYAGFCPKCKGKAYTKDIGVCSNCKDGVTTSGQFKLCMACSAKLNECEHCRAAVKPAFEPIDPDNDGVYKSGKWEYRYKVGNKGSKSQGYFGELLYNNKIVAEPEAVNDFHKTPWGPIYWVGKPIVAFGGHGWMLKPKVSEKAGKELPEPTNAKAPDMPVK